MHLITLCSSVTLSFCDIHNGVSGELIYGLFSTFVVNRLKGKFYVIRHKRRQSPRNPGLTDHGSSQSYQEKGQEQPARDRLYCSHVAVGAYRIPFHLRLGCEDHGAEVEIVQEGEILLSAKAGAGAVQWLHHNSFSLPEKKGEKKDQKAAQEYGIPGANAVATGDPGQAVQELGPVDLRLSIGANDYGLAGLAHAPVMVVAVVCVLKPFQILEILGQARYAAPSYIR